MRIRPSLALILALLAAPGATRAGEPVTPAREAALANLLRHDCGACHGLTRKGGLGPPLQPARFAGRSAEEIAEVILRGVPDTPMPPWGRLLSRADALWLAGRLKQGASKEEPRDAGE